MADEIRNADPQFQYDVMRNRFFNAYHQSTSGSQGRNILKWLHEDMNAMTKSTHFGALERAAEVLQGLGNDDPHPLLFSQVVGAFEALMRDWKTDNMPRPYPLWEAHYDPDLQSLDDWNIDIVGGKL